MARSSIRVAVLTNAIPYYRHPLFRELAQTPGWKLRVFIDGPGVGGLAHEVDLSQTPYPVVSLHSVGMSRPIRMSRTARDESNSRVVRLPLGLPMELLRFRPQLVISGELGMRTAIAAAHGGITRTPVVGWVESTKVTSSSLTASQVAFRRALSRRLAAFICPGTATAQYLQELGVTQPVTQIGQPFADVEIEHSTSVALPRQRNRTVLFAGRLEREKGVRELMHAWREVSQDEGREGTLLIAGQGSERPWLEWFVERHNLGSVQLMGLLSPQELEYVRRSSDVFVLPTHGDCFSLAVVEAMASGLPVIGSVLGGESELISNETGWLCNPHEPDSLANALRGALQRSDLQVMRSAATARAHRMTTVAVAASIRGLVESVASA